MTSHLTSKALRNDDYERGLLSTNVPSQAQEDAVNNASLPLSPVRTIIRANTIPHHYTLSHSATHLQAY